MSAEFSDADCIKTDFTGADARCASFRRANLTGACLVGADLTGADFTYADLTAADLTGANLTGALFIEATLVDANCTGAILRSTSLQGANLARVILDSVDLRHTDLEDADLTGVQLSTHVLACARLLITPEGDLIGHKQCRDGVIVTVRIPAGVPRSNATGRKCRAERAIVIAVDGATEGVSIYDETYIYRVGETVLCHRWEPDRFIECGGGIHFYLTRVEAEAHISV